VTAPLTAAPAERRGAAAVPAPRRLLLLGNPNTGKTTLFNRLCGLRAKTANFPGTTTDLRVGKLLLADPGAPDTAIVAEVVDLPGVYSLDLDLPESKVAATLAGSPGAPGRRDQSPTPPTSRGTCARRRARAHRRAVRAGAQHDRPGAAAGSRRLEAPRRALGAPVVAAARAPRRGLEPLCRAPGVFRATDGAASLVVRLTRPAESGGDSPRRLAESRRGASAARGVGRQRRFSTGSTIASPIRSPASSSSIS
jgi:hypothetical protein